MDTTNNNAARSSCVQQTNRQAEPLLLPKPIAVDLTPSSLNGKRAGMVVFSPYPMDPRPRRAAEALIREGMSVDLVCEGDGKMPGREKLDALEVIRIPIKRRRGGPLSYAWQYAMFILGSTIIFGWRALKHRYDLIYVHNMPDVLVISALIPKVLGAKVILDQHDPMPELVSTIFGLRHDSLGVRVAKRLEKWSVARANLVITVNHACKRIFVSRSCQPTKIGVVMNTPDEAIFAFRPPQLGGRRNRASSAHFVVMYHGSLVARNGLEIAVDAMQLLRSRIPWAELRIYGHKTPFLDKVMQSVRDRALDKCIHYLGPMRLEELVDAIGDCDVGVIPNPRTAFTEINTPTRIFEYLALGKPVIAPRTPGIEDYFDPDSLLFFDPGNAIDLAQRLESSCHRNDEVKEIVRRGQCVYLAHTWRQERQVLVKMVRDLLEGGKTN